MGSFDFSFAEYLTRFNALINNNQGTVSVAIFLITAIYGWWSGIFTSLRRRPVLSVELICGPTFSCTFPTGDMHNGFEAHRTCISLYMKVSNVGSADSSIENISVGYHWTLRPAGIQWVKYRIGWFWLHEQAVSISDFHVKIGDNFKVYPFLTQRNSLSPAQVDTYLTVGRSVNGVVYFEQNDSWGGSFPLQQNGKTVIKIKLRDVFGREHISKHRISTVSLDEARKYNPTFGTTFEELRRGQSSDSA